LLTPDQKHQRAASSVEFFKMVYDDRNVWKRIVTSDESTIQKQNVRVQFGWVQRNRKLRN
jgi:hypothetical protein